jgi:SAM-dependent methyltransferase
MLELAKARDKRVVWIEAMAQGLDLGCRFDAVVMTGHAFQCLLTKADRMAVLKTIARHLAPGGGFFFDSRNPQAREWKGCTPADTRVRRTHPEFGEVERWIEAGAREVSGVIEYRTHYRLQEGRHLQARSRIAFPGFDELSSALSAAGLRVDRWYGDAAGGPLRPGCPDFIPLGGLA